MKSWQDFTAWANRMFHRAGKIDPATEKFLRQLVKDCKTDTEKSQTDLRFSLRPALSDRTGRSRGVPPAYAGAVINSRYGDCKDKANALIALARKLGIKGYRVLVNRGRWTDEKFPSWQFNHMVAYFPKLSAYPQGLWLDATDGATRFGALPPGDLGRVGMLIKKDSFEFKTITLSGNSKNTIERNIELTPVTGSGKLSGTVLISASGLPDYRLRQKIKRLSPRQLDFFTFGLINHFYPGSR